MSTGDVWSEHRRRARARRLLDERRARRDPASFVQHCFRDEKTGKPVENAPHHVAWQSFLSATRWGVVVAPVEHGKSVQIGIGRVIWELGNNPDLRILLVGESGASAEKLLRGIMQQIQYNPRVRRVFPALRPGTRKGDQWNESNITVERPGLARDPSVQARGIGSLNIIGSRLDLVVLDDCLNFENTATKLQRDKLEDWFDTVVFTRLVDDYESGAFGRVFAIGTPWNGDDLLHRLSRREGWRSSRWSAVENPDDPPARWRPTWRGKWPLQRLLEKRTGMTETAFARKYLCRVLSEGLRRFKRAWIDHMFRQGKGRRLGTWPRWRGALLRCVTGVDIGIGQRDVDALTSIFTLAVEPRSKRRIVVELKSGHWTGPEILDELEKTTTAYGSELIVESNAAQKFIAQFSRERGIAVRTYFTTASNKFDEELGVESLAVEMRNGLWIVPSPTGRLEDADPELRAWAEELLEFDPAQHTGDRLMASWIARQGALGWTEDRVGRSDHTFR